MDALLYTPFVGKSFRGEGTLSFFPDTQLVTFGFPCNLLLSCTYKGYHPLVAQACSLAFVLDQHFGLIPPPISISNSRAC